MSNTDARSNGAAEPRRRDASLGRRRAARDDRARALGFADANELLRHGYEVEGATVAELAKALGCAESTATAEMDRLGVQRRPQADRLAEGHRAQAAARARVRVDRDARVRALGFDDMASYLRARHHDQRWPRRLIAEELGVTVRVVIRLIRAEGVRGRRGVKAATAR